MADDAGRWLRAGRVGRPHGLDGSFYVRDPSPLLLTEGTRVLVGGGERAIIRRAGDDRRPIVRLEGHSDREAAEALGGEPLMVPRDAAPELDAEEWWEEDLVGCAVHQGDRAVGTVRRLLALPSVDVLEVGRSDGKDDLLIPLVTDAVKHVDVESKRIEVDLHFLAAE